MRHYCTYFDRNYLVQGLTLYRSLVRHGAPCTLWVLCLDTLTFDTLAQIGDPGLRPVPLRALEEADDALASVKEQRSVVEYYFTLSPIWPQYLLDKHPGIDVLTYLDADLMFYSSPEPVFEELGSKSVLIVGHRFPAHLRHLEQHGVFNVGWLSFRNDAAGRAVLSRWREQCLAWCHDRVEDGKFADQKYLDDWPTRFGVHVLQHPGAGLAPWNWMNHKLRWHEDVLFVDDVPLIFFHFHGLKLINQLLFRPSESTYGPIPRTLVHKLYRGYLRALASTRSWLKVAAPAHALQPPRNLRYTPPSFRQLLHELQHGYVRPRIGSIAL